MTGTRRITILGVGIDDVDTDEALTIMEEFILSRKPHMVVTADSSGIVLSRHDPELRAIINAADLVTPDSYGILWAARRQGTPLRERVSGVDIVRLLCKRAAEKGYPVFFLEPHLVWQMPPLRISNENIPGWLLLERIMAFSVTKNHPKL